MSRHTPHPTHRRDVTIVSPATMREQSPISNFALL